ncbi:hypothetical protein ACS0TY_002609 [Phlomoides rotata]
MLVVNGRWLKDGGNCTIINVYAPNVPAQRWELWDCIQALVNQYVEDRMCIVRDFNAIKEKGERVGRAATWDENDMIHFNNFIRGSDLLEISLIGRSYTWYRPNSACKSKLNRLLVNASWVSKWPDVRLKGGRQTLSDHVPIFIEGRKKDWGPKPFKFFNQWINHKDYMEVVEGLKTLKIELKKWSREVFGELDKKIEDKKVEIERLDMIDDTLGLDENEEDQRQQLLDGLMKESNWREK